VMADQCWYHSAVLEKSGATERWVPAFPTDQVRGLKAHGTTMKSKLIIPTPVSPHQGGGLDPALPPP
jgi:hypothetical protein